MTLSSAWVRVRVTLSSAWVRVRVTLSSAWATVTRRRLRCRCRCWCALVIDGEGGTTDGGCAVLPPQNRGDGVRPVSKLRGVKGISRTIAGRACEVEGRHLLGPDAGSGLPRIVEIEGNPLEPPLIAHEDIDLALHRQAVESHRTRSIRVHTDGEPRPRGSRGSPNADDAEDPEYQGKAGAERDQPPPYSMGSEPVFNLLYPRRLWRRHCPSRAWSRHGDFSSPEEKETKALSWPWGDYTHQT